MKLSKFDWFLVVVIGFGGILAWQSGREQNRLWNTYERLTRTTGDFPIADPSRVHVRALKTEGPLHFAWRVYLPPNYQLTIRTSTGSSMSSSRAGACEFIARVRFREDEQGDLHVYTHLSGSSSRFSLGDKPLTELLHGRWDKVRVEQLGADHPSAIEPDHSAVLLRLTLPDDIRDEARQKRPAPIQERFVPELFKLEIGPEALKP